MAKNFRRANGVQPPGFAPHHRFARIRFKLTPPKHIKKDLRTLRHQLRFAMRKYSAGLRCLPHFLIIGAQKSGTTSLFKFISQHYQVLPAITKEIHFFDGGLEPHVDLYQKGERWYKAHFPLRMRTRQQRITGEASPLYLFNPLAAQRIHRLMPDVKLIALLRNPTERAISHYFHEVRKGREGLPIKEALQLEDQRMSGIITQNDFKNSLYLHASYKTRGLYLQQLERYLRYFTGAQLLVLESESFFMNPKQTLEQAFNFLGIDPDFPIPDTRPRNVSRNRTRVDPDIYNDLNGFFHGPNQKLFETIQQTFHWNEN